MTTRRVYQSVPSSEAQSDVHRLDKTQGYLRASFEVDTPNAFLRVVSSFKNQGVKLPSLGSTIHKSGKERFISRVRTREQHDDTLWYPLSPRRSSSCASPDGSTTILARVNNTSSSTATKPRPSSARSSPCSSGSRPSRRTASRIALSRSEQRPRRVLALGGRRRGAPREDVRQHLQHMDETPVRVRGLAARRVHATLNP